ncbi:PucR family transcriptional regulator [Kineosporia succinea]|uniref:Purine catabolism regulator n=1 Tax=Kineosporia succinea TaxID=84632 RepID=A0ABT9NVE6_9ACTN|nr:PucR family transcriptional regulator [Kineosporia succinea]MDP9824394.1 hypothetical protein [Kineosporia succinea]
MFRPNGGPTRDASSPAAPPSPETVSLAALTGLDLTWLTGSEARVRWAHVSELEDPAPYLAGGELLLTAGRNLPHDEPAVLDAYVASLAGAGVAAIGFGLAPVHAQVPALLVKACEKHGLPLVAVPERTPFLAVSQAVADALEQQRSDQRRVASEAQGRITRAALRGQPRVPAVLAELATAIGGWAVLLDATGRPVHHSPGAPDPTLDTLRLAVRLAQGSGPRSATDVIGGVHIDLHPVDSAQSHRHVLLLGRDTPLTAADRTVRAVGVGLLALLADSERTAGGTQNRLLTRLLTEGPELSPHSARLLRTLVPEGPVRVLRAARTSMPEGEPVSMADELRTSLVDVTDDDLVAVVPAQLGVEELSGLHVRTGWLAALSRPVPLAQVSDADQEARRLLERAVVAGEPLVGRSAGSGVGTLVDRSMAEAWAGELLGPLVPVEGGELLGLLRVFLTHHGSWDATARATGLHRNSVRHRIARVERLLETDLGDPAVRADLWLALAWHA